MTLRSALLALAVAIAAGGLVGAERQQAHAGRPGSDFGGVRTFPLVALAGALGALLRPVFGAWLLGSILLGVVGLLAVAHARARDAAEAGVSSEMAAIVTLVLGALAGSHELLPDGPRFLLVAAGAATTMGLLALKRPLHGFVARLSEDDVYATAKFVLLALVAIPLLPNRTYGPLDVLNPFKIGLMIVLVAGISFAGYVAARVVGSRRGLLVSGLLGGLVSSTAVTLTFAGRARETPPLVPLSAVAIVAASSVMFARMLTVVGLVDRSLVGSVAVPLGGMAVIGVALSVVLYRRELRQGGAGEDLPLQNPFQLRRSVAFGLFYGLVLFVAKAAQVYVGRWGIYASAVVAGLADVDAITISLAELHRAGATARAAAASGITLAALTNTLAKGMMALVVGGWPLGRRVGLCFVVVLGGGAAALLLW